MPKSSPKIRVETFLNAEKYYHGEGVKKDLNKAIQYYQQAVDLKHPPSIYNLALCYQKGEGVKMDLRKANQLFKEAKELGLGFEN